MSALTLTPKSRSAFLADRYAIQPNETVSVYASELSCLLISEESLQRQVAQLQQKVDLLQSLLDTKPIQHINLYV